MRKQDTKARVPEAGREGPNCQRLKGLNHKERPDAPNGTVAATSAENRRRSAEAQNHRSLQDAESGDNEPTDAN